ncbi:Protein of unknown function [Pyronema omphalodes CBS 100304]|uniref:Uncharacterized protein n=1 Tax=Pyronema omphalodes (strain CBS 100304) TaxID=1076935 RepID=U4LFH4_PYROM|nr:Protein of unknown function [Pyronema omphalodes CBS 100304]
MLTKTKASYSVRLGLKLLLIDPLPSPQHKLPARVAVGRYFSPNPRLISISTFPFESTATYWGLHTRC